MFIGHLPAGYLATTAVLGRAASVLPDLDLLYFYFVSDRRQVHHAYLPHLPLACLAAMGAAALVLWIVRARPTAWLALGVFGLNVMLHLVLDTSAGGIRWLWPFSHEE